MPRKRFEMSRASLQFLALSALCLLTAAAPVPHAPRITGSDILDVAFLQNYNTRLVVLSTTLLGITSGIIGTFLLLRKRSLMGDALSHATLPGIALAYIVMVSLGGTGKNLPGLLLGDSITGVLGVFLVLMIRNTTRLQDDAAMGIVLSVFFGFGVALLGVIQKMPKGSAAGLESFIYGKTASMVMQDFLLIAGVAIVVAVLCALLHKELTLLCFDEGFAATQGWPTLPLDLAMLGMVSAVTVVGLQAVGLILIIAFLIIPAAAARFWSLNLRKMLWLAAGIGGASGWLGASLSALLPNLPAGAIIVLVAASIFVVSMLAGTAHGVIPRMLRQAQLRRKVGRQHLLRAAFEIVESLNSDTNTPIRNLPVSYPQLLVHRSWSPRELHNLLRIGASEDHIESWDEKEVRLSESGFGEASRVTRNHRLWEQYLIMHADIAPSHVDRDADMVEHVLGAEMVRQLEAELEHRDPSMAMPPSPHAIDAQPSES